MGERSRPLRPSVEAAIPAVLEHVAAAMRNGAASVFVYLDEGKPGTFTVWRRDRGVQRLVATVHGVTDEPLILKLKRRARG